MGKVNSKRLTCLTGSLLVLICISIVIVLLAANPLRQSESRIRDRALKAIPFGSTLAEVAAIAKAKGWKVELELHTGNAPDSFPMPNGTPRKAPLNGEYLSRINMGHYAWFPVPIRVDVESYWIFDPTGKLIEMYIWKVGDLP